MAVLVLAEHDGKELSQHTSRAIAAARTISGDIDVLVLGFHLDAVADQASRLPAIRTVQTIDDASLESPLPETSALAIIAVSEAYDTLVSAATSFGKSTMPRVAALLDVMQVSEVIAVLAPDLFKRLTYAGNAIQTVRSTDTKRVLTIRTASFQPLTGNGQAAIQRVNWVARPAPVAIIEQTMTRSDRADLSTAQIVVAGGLGLGSREGFEQLLFPLADKLSAALGTSRAAVDAGYAPNDWQVGQTGKVVSPDLYIAIGISGAIQHLAGMQDARVIVAINKDADAPIFQTANYGLVGDLFEIVPALVRAL